MGSRNRGGKKKAGLWGEETKANLWGEKKKKKATRSGLGSSVPFSNGASRCGCGVLSLLYGVYRFQVLNVLCPVSFVLCLVSYVF